MFIFLQQRVMKCRTHVFRLHLVQKKQRDLLGDLILSCTSTEIIINRSNSWTRLEHDRNAETDLPFCVRYIKVTSSVFWFCYELRNAIWGRTACQPALFHVHPSLFLSNFSSECLPIPLEKYSEGDYVKRYFTGWLCCADDYVSVPYLCKIPQYSCHFTLYL